MILKPAGDLTIFEVGALYEEIKQAVTAHPQVELDLSEVDTLDATSSPRTGNTADDVIRISLTGSLLRRYLCGLDVVSPPNGFSTPGAPGHP